MARFNPESEKGTNTCVPLAIFWSLSHCDLTALSKLRADEMNSTTPAGLRAGPEAVDLSKQPLALTEIHAD
jgi:hypothetical protein